MKYTTRINFSRALAVTSVAALTVVGTAWGNDEESASASTTSTTVSDSSSTHSTASSTDKHAARFLKEATQGNQMELEMAGVALSKAQNSEVKSFAQHLQKDHRDVQTKLTSLIQRHGIQIDKPGKTSKEVEGLQELSASEFDREFMKMALRDHQKDIAKYQKAIEQVQAADVKQFAQETLPKLRQHLSHAAQVAQTVGVDSATISAYTKPAADAFGGSTTTGESSDDASGSSRETGAKELKEHETHDLKEPSSSDSLK